MQAKSIAKDSFSVKGNVRDTMKKLVIGVTLTSSWSPGIMMSLYISVVQYFTMLRRSVGGIIRPLSEIEEEELDGLDDELEELDDELEELDDELEELQDGL